VGFDSVICVDSSLTSPSHLTPGQTPEIEAAPRSRRRLLAAAVVATAFLLTGCQLPTFGAYRGATTQARTTFHLWQGFFIAGIVVGGFVLCLILWAVIRYRRKSEEIPTQTQYHTTTEIIYTIVPIVIVLVLFVFTVLAENKVDATPANPGAKIHVYAFQWGWEFKYPNGVKVIGQTTDDPTMVVPSGTEVAIRLDSYDVLHGFYVPEFNFSRYASPGYSTYFDFDVIHNGDYRGQCTQLCGLYHSLMFFNVKAVSQSDYAAWLRTELAQQRAHPSSVSHLPSGVNTKSSSSSSASNASAGGDPYGD
jgi:cytochrome c oxidase subunit 2